MSLEHRELEERLAEERLQKEQFKTTKNQIEDERRLLDRTVEKLQKEVRGGERAPTGRCRVQVSRRDGCGRG